MNGVSASCDSLKLNEQEPLLPRFFNGHNVF